MTKTQTLIHRLLEARQPIPRNQIKKQILNWFKIYNTEEIEVTKVGPSVYVNILIDTIPVPLIDDQADEYTIDPDEFDKKVLKNSGWYTSSLIKSEYSDEEDDGSVLYEFSLDLEPSISLKIEKPRFLYHITRTCYADKIMKQGIKPKVQTERNLRFPEPRVYLFIRDGLHNGASIFPIGNVTVFKVDTKKFNRFNIYEDDRIPGGEAVWTPTHIPSHAIERLISGDARYWEELLYKLDDKEFRKQ